MSEKQIRDAFDEVEKALLALNVALKQPALESNLHIDGTIQRFEFSIELFWKLLKRLLASKGVVAQYPKDVLRQSFAGGLIADETMWLDMLNSRNLTSHTYNEDLAEEIYEKIQGYYPFLQTAFNTLKAKNF